MLDSVKFTSGFKTRISLYVYQVLTIDLKRIREFVMLVQYGGCSKCRQSLLMGYYFLGVKSVVICDIFSIHIQTDFLFTN